MPKVITPKLLLIIAITVICVILTTPTARYFTHVALMSDPPTQEQLEKRNELLENPRVIKLGLDLQGGADFLIAIQADYLVRQRMENEMEERLRANFRRDDIDASLRIIGTDIDDLRLSISLNNPADAELATDIIQTAVDESPLLSYNGNVGDAVRSGEIELTPNTGNLREQVSEAMDGALKVIKERVDQFGLTQPIVQKAEGNRIRVQIPGENDPERIRNSLLQTAQLEFRLLHPEHDTVIEDFIQGGILRDVGTGRIKPELMEEYVIEETGRIATRIKTDIPGVPAGFTLKLGKKTVIDPTTGVVLTDQTIDDLVYVVRQNAPLTGENLRRASVFVDPRDLENPVKVSIEFDNVGAKTFADITTDNVGKRFAIILDNTVFSAPNINEPITNGGAVISGGFTQAEARDLSLVLKAGALPAPLKIVEDNTIGPSLGADSITGASKAVIIGGILIILMMTLIYHTAGAISVLAMFLNVLLIMAVLSLMGATLTLSGIGGILLTMGMAVDANILIYERLREELAAGNPLRAAINQSFARAYTVILDANMTSLFPALVLVLFEVVDGSVKGFWVALAIGLLANLYTGVVVTRALMEAWYTKFRSVNVGTFHVFKKVSIRWMHYRKVAIAFSGSIALIAIGYLVVSGPSYGIDFTGGVLATVEVKQDTNSTEISDLFSEYNDVRAIRVVNTDLWQVTVPKAEGVELTDIRENIVSSMTAQFGENFSLESTQSVESTVGDEFKTVAIFSVIITCAVILTFLAFRFQWIFGAGAVVALLHDVFMSLAVFKLLGHSLTLDIVSALLIILGYSVNDTIVVFDRIREKMQERLSGSIEDIINLAINETLNRTVLTSGSTFFAVATMYFFGGSGLSDFALILLLGIFFGTYSSIFIASALVYVYLKSRGITTVIQARKATARVVAPKVKKQISNS